MSGNDVRKIVEKAVTVLMPHCNVCGIPTRLSIYNGSISGASYNHYLAFLKKSI
jgi:hypothetical protein